MPMYREYFGLKETPFSIAPDPHYFYMSEGHREALAHLVYGINSDGGFVLLTGEVGTGKTTVCRCLLEQIPENCEIAFILNPKMTVVELLATICDEFGITYPNETPSIKSYVSRINDFLLDVHEKGKRAILIIEEAQNLSVEVLEQIRLLTNLETNQRKLLQIIMLGQPELREILAQPQLRQLSQRITARYHLGPLPKNEIATYVNHRLAVAGLIRGDLFPAPVLDLLYRLTGGVPRLINVICDRALLGAYVQGKGHVDKQTLRTAASEVSGKKTGEVQRAGARLWATAAVIILLVATIVTTLYLLRSKTPLAETLGIPAEKVRTQNASQQKGLPGGERPGETLPVSTRDTAYGSLFGAWNITYDPKDSRSVCEQARAQGLSCVEGKDTLDVIRRMNKPAVLRLIDERGREYYATLLSLDGDTATYVVDRETTTGKAQDLGRRWSGDFLLLWRAPAEYRDELTPGSRGTLVAWLERQLASVRGKQAPSGTKRVYDGEMVKEVKEFQSSKGLVADGIIGPMTLIHLTSGTPGSGPVLREEKGAN